MAMAMKPERNLALSGDLQKGVEIAKSADFAFFLPTCDFHWIMCDKNSTAVIKLIKQHFQTLQLITADATTGIPRQPIGVEEFTATTQILPIFWAKG